MKNLNEKFEEIMEMVQEKYNKAWYEVYDSELFDEVEELIKQKLGASILDTKEYINWEREMYNDL